MGTRKGDLTPLKHALSLLEDIKTFVRKMAYNLNFHQQALLNRLTLGYCQDIQDERDEGNTRYYAHVFCRPFTICCSDDLFECPNDIQVGILLHEIGHLMSQSCLDKDADLWVFDQLNIVIAYTPNASALQYIEAEDLERITG